MSQTIQNLVGLLNKQKPKLEGSSLVIKKTSSMQGCFPTPGLDQGFEKILESQISHPIWSSKDASTPFCE